MRKRTVRLAVLIMLMAACGTDTGDPTTTLSEVAASGTSRPDTTRPTPTSVAAEDPSAYLVDMSNLIADLDSRLSDFAERYGRETPPPSTDEEIFVHSVGFWLGLVDTFLAWADEVEEITPPASMTAAHQSYLLGARYYYEAVGEYVTSLSTLEEVDRFTEDVFGGAPLPPGINNLFLTHIETCNALEAAAAESGYEADLDCPTPPPDNIEVEVATGAVWSVSPAQVPTGNTRIVITIFNSGSESIRPVVVDIFEGDPQNLPLQDGYVEIGLSGVFDSESDHASFGVAYAEGVDIVEGGFIGQPAELHPGESVEVVSWSNDGAIVVFDYRQGEFENGAFVVITRA